MTLKYDLPRIGRYHGPIAGYPNGAMRHHGGNTRW